jgi:hypothetical protein
MKLHIVTIALVVFNVSKAQLQYVYARIACHYQCELVVSVKRIVPLIPCHMKLYLPGRAV